MAAKTKNQEEIPAINHNVITNNNTNNVTVKMENPKRRSASTKKKKPNWILRTVVVGIIGLVLSAVGYYVKTQIDKNEPAPSIHYPAIDGQRTDH